MYQFSIQHKEEPSPSFEDQVSQKFLEIDSTPLPKSSALQLFRAIFSNNNSDTSGSYSNSVEYWVQVILGIISSGQSLQRLYRVVSTLSKLEDGNVDDASAEYYGFTADNHPRSSESLRMRPIKRQEGLIFLENPFVRGIFDPIFNYIKPLEFTMDNIIKCTFEADFSAILSDGLGETSPLLSLVDPFFLSILYVKLLVSSPQDRSYKSIYQALLSFKSKNSFSLFGNYTLSYLIDAIIDRRLRFHVANPNTNEEDVFRELRSTIFFNEFFESCELDFNTKKKIHKMQRQKNKVFTEEQLEKRRKEQIVQLETSFERISFYLRKSPFIVMVHLRSLYSEKELVPESLVWKENVQLLNKVLDIYTSPRPLHPQNERRESRHLNSLPHQFGTFSSVELEVELGKFKSSTPGAAVSKRSRINIDEMIVEYCLQVYTLGIQTIHQLAEEKDLRVLDWFIPLTNKATSLVLQYLETSDPSVRTLSATLYPKMMLFLGASFGLNPGASENTEKVFAMFTNAMRNTPEAITQPDRVGVMLTAVSHFIIGLEGDALRETVHLLLHMSRALIKNPDNAITPILEDAKDLPPVLLPESNTSTETVVDYGLTILQLFQYVFQTKINRATLSEEDAAIVATELKNIFFLTNRSASSSLKNSNAVSLLMSLFAIAGLLNTVPSLATNDLPFWKSMMSDFHEIVHQATLQFNHNVTHNGQWRDPNNPNREVWKIAVSVLASCACANAHVKFTYDMAIVRDIILEVFLEDVIGFRWIFDELKCGFQETIRKLESHKRGRLFKQQTSVFIKAISTLFTSSSLEAQQQTLNRLEDYAKKLHHEWRTYRMVVSTTKEKSKQEDEQFTRSIIPLFQTIGLSFTLLFKNLINSLEGDQIVTTLNIFGYLNFLRVDFPAYQELMRALFFILAQEKDASASTKLLHLLPAELYNSNLPNSARQFDVIGLSRIYFLLAMTEKILLSVPEEAVEERIIPLIQMGICSANENINRNAHNLFRALSLNSERYFRFIPIYLRLSLENFPKLTAASSLRESLIAIVKSLPEPQNGVTLYVLRMLNQKISSMQGKPRVELTLVLFSLAPHINLQLLDDLLDLSRNLLLSVPSQPLREEMCAYLLDTITNNYDYSRKTKCIKWYLQLHEEVKQMPG
eukprot:TRINITY_DN2882_c0_g1_i3.p1 TRINITY_DN2882_c0_g1~~TRINITY_DN2882_c0_g1_i3.p1  ORF type:complete len:1146 (-),score=289.77 TRINITY_DN2882_c0_g1_i3:74-3511(-)